MKKVLFITPPDAQYGFSLAGVGQFVPVRSEVAAQILEMTRDPSLGVIVVDERLIDTTVRGEIDDLQRRWSGVIVVLPAPEPAPEPAEDYAMRLIRQAIGYQVRVNV